MHASAAPREGPSQRSFACISSGIATVIQVRVGAIKGTITDLMSHSQFHCTGRVHLDLHGLIFETSICYWQDQPGSFRSEAPQPSELGGCNRPQARPPGCLGTRGTVGGRELWKSLGRPTGGRRGECVSRRATRGFGGRRGRRR